MQIQMEDVNTTETSSLPNKGSAETGLLDVQVGLTLFGIVCFIVSTVGNCTVIHLIRTRMHMRNVTNILIANMSAADLLMTILVFPYLIKFYYIGSKWFGGIAGSVTCTVVHSSQMVSIFGSVYTLLVISVDRCLAVMQPMKKYFTKTVTKWSIVLVWLVSVIFSIPLMIALKVINDDTGYHCVEDWGKMDQSLYIIMFLLLTYIVPLGLIGSVYTVTGRKLWGCGTAKSQENPLNRSNHESVRASRRKATKMLVTVVVLFALCWFPLQVRELIHVTWPDTLRRIPIKLDMLLPWFGFFNSCTNPIIYVIFSDRFRREFKRVLCFWKRHEDIDVFSTPGSPVTRTRLATIRKQQYSNLTPLGTPDLSERSPRVPKPSLLSQKSSL